MWHVFFFFSICSVAEASIRASAWPCQRKKKGRGRAQRGAGGWGGGAPSKLTAALSIKVCWRWRLGIWHQLVAKCCHSARRCILSDGAQDSRLWHLLIAAAWKRAHQACVARGTGIKFCWGGEGRDYLTAEHWCTGGHNASMPWLLDPFGATSTARIIKRTSLAGRCHSGGPKS